MAHLTNFSFEFVYEIFTADASLPFLYHGAKKSKMTKNSNQGGGSCLKSCNSPYSEIFSTSLAINERTIWLCWCETKFTLCISFWNGACAYYVMVSKNQWKPFFACHPALSREWLGWVAISCQLYNVFAQAALACVLVTQWNKKCLVNGWHNRRSL